MTRAALTRQAGRVFETPVLEVRLGQPMSVRDLIRKVNNCNQFKRNLDLQIQFNFFSQFHDLKFMKD